MAERNHDDWIAEKLKAEADRHEPDLDRIRARIAEHRGDHPARRSTWLLPAAAATFVVLTAGAITAVYSGQSGPDGQVSVVGPAGVNTDLPSVTPTGAASAPSADPSAGPSPSATTGPSASGSAAAGPAKPTTTTPAAHQPPTGGPAGDPKPGTPAAPGPAVDLKLVAVEAGRGVTLPGGAADWIAAGSSVATQNVRRTPGEQTISGPHETGSATSTSARGPFSLSWTGGSAEPSRSGSRTWRTVTGPDGGPETGLLLRVPAEKRTRTFTLYVGASQADGQLRTRLGSQTGTTRLKASTDGYIATIRFHTDHPGDELEVKLIRGTGGSVAFAAATLR